MSSLDYSFRRKPPESQGSGLTLDTALLDSSGDHLLGPGVTFAKQDELPRLPIPELQDTLNKFLQNLEALQSTEERLHAQQVVLEFIKGDGPKLQELLKAYEHEGVKTGTLGSYIEEFWNDSYLVPDQSVVLNLNPFFVLEDGPDPKIAKDPIRRAASLCFATVKLASSIREQTLLPDTFKGNPLCMDQYKAVFGATRVPNADGDEVEVYPQSSHVVAMCRNQIFYFQVLWPDGTVAVDEEDIVEILTAIDKNSKTQNLPEAARTCPGVLTSLGRRKWFQVRSEIVALETNDHYLTIIDSGLFVLVLDDFIPNSLDEAANNMLHGTYNIQHDNSDPDYPGNQLGSCCNRWYDKLQLIVCGDGTAGVNFEHSAIDGHTALRIVSDIYAETVVNFAQSITKTLPTHGKIPNIIDANVDRAGASGARKSVGDKRRLDILPKKLTLKLTEKLQRRIFHAETALGDEIISCETRVLEFREYGKQLIVSNNLSPDAYIQMSMMLAYYQLYGKLVCTYEPVLTKAYFHGRTEAMRSATIPAKNLCEAFFNPDIAPKEKYFALRRATAVHKKFVKECSLGKGVDRHLFALKCIAEKEGMPLPAFFTSEPWKMLNHTILSTSNCGNPSLRLFGFGPVVPKGYGIGYIIKDHSIHYSVSSKRRQTQRFVAALNSVLKGMAQLLSKRSKSARTVDQSRSDHCGDVYGVSAQEVKRARSGGKVGTMRKEQPKIPEDEDSIETIDLMVNVNPEPVRRAVVRKNNKPRRKYNVEEAQQQLMVLGSEHTVRHENINNSRPTVEKNDSNHRHAPVSRRSMPDISSGYGPLSSSDFQPTKPTRRGSMFGRMAEKQTLSVEMLSMSGISLDLELALGDSDDDS